MQDLLVKAAYLPRAATKSPSLQYALTSDSLSAWYLYKMVAQNMLRTYVENRIFSENNFGFDDSFDVTKCLQQIEMSGILHMCAQ